MCRRVEIQGHKAESKDGMRLTGRQRQTNRSRTQHPPPLLPQKPGPRPPHPDPQRSRTVWGRREDWAEVRRGPHSATGGQTSRCPPPKYVVSEFKGLRGCDGHDMAQPGLKKHGAPAWPRALTFRRPISLTQSCLALASIISNILSERRQRKSG